MVTIAPAFRASSTARRVDSDNGWSLLRIVPSMSRTINLYFMLASAFIVIRLEKFVLTRRKSGAVQSKARSLDDHHPNRSGHSGVGHAERSMTHRELSHIGRCH